MNDNGAYVTTVRIQDTYVTNVYKAPPASLQQSHLVTYLHPSVYVGDFNSHHQEWCYQDADANGEFLVEWASTNALHRG